MAKQVIKTTYVDEELGITVTVLRTPKPRRTATSTRVTVCHTLGEGIDITAKKEQRVASLSMSKRANGEGN